MTLLRRAPREVYRVYGEEEFFAGAAHGERLEPSTSRPAAQRLPGLAGATMLLAAAAAVGGLIAARSFSSSARARRPASGGLLAAARALISSPAAGTRVWRQGSGRDRPPAASVSVRSVERVRVLARAHTSALASAPRRGRARERMPSGRSRQGTVRAQEPMPWDASRPAGSSGQPPQGGPDEFGFER